MADKNKITGGLNWLPHQCATMGCIYISEVFCLLLFPKLYCFCYSFIYKTIAFFKIKLIFVIPSFQNSFYFTN